MQEISSNAMEHNQHSSADNNIHVINAEHSNHNDDGNVHKNEEQTTSIPLRNESSFVADNPDPHTNNNTDTTTEKDTSASEPQNDDTTRIDADHTTQKSPSKVAQMEEPIPDSQPNNAMVDTNNKDDQATRSEAEHSTQESPSKAAEETVPDSQPSIDIVDTNNNEFGLVPSTLFCIFFHFSL